MNVYIYNTKTTIKASAPETNRYFDGTGTVVFFRKSNGKVIAAQTSGVMDDESMFTYVELIADQTGRSMDRGLIVGMILGGVAVGELPTNVVPFYVYK